MIEMTFVLLLMIGEERVEYTPYKNLSECLSVRRKIKRNVGHSSNLIKSGHVKNSRSKCQAARYWRL